jgi:hypothetical protein
MSHEPQGLDSRRLGLTGVILALSTAFVLAACFVLWKGWVASAPRPVDRSAEPALQTRPTRDLATFRREQAAQDRWEWVDKEHTVARVPVERAMRIMAREPSR